MKSELFIWGMGLMGKVPKGFNPRAAIPGVYLAVMEFQEAKGDIYPSFSGTLLYPKEVLGERNSEAEVGLGQCSHASIWDKLGKEPNTQSQLLPHT